MVHAGPQVLGQWAPLYDALLAGWFALAGPDPLGARLAQVVVSTGCVALAYGLARANGSRRAGRIAALLFAVDPSLIAFTHYLFSETLFVALLLGAVYALFRRPEAPGRRDALLGGVLLGLATLTRSVALYFLPLWLALSLLRRRRAEARRAALVLAAALCVVLPWTARNAFKYHGFLLVDGTVARTAYFAFSEILFNQDLGYNTLLLPRERSACTPGRAPGVGPLPSVEEAEALFRPGMYGLLGDRDAAAALALALRFARIDLVESQRCELGRALDFTRREPATVASHILQRFYAFWGPNSFLLRAIARQVYPDGPLAPECYPLWKWTVVGWHAALLSCALLLFGRRRVPPLARFVVGFAAYYTAMHMLAVAHSRYRLPLMPLVGVLAALWLASPRMPEGPARRLGVGALLLGALALFAHYAIWRLP